MSALAAVAAGPGTAPLDGIAARMIDIAEQVAREAEAAAALVRAMTDQAARVATLASGLEASAAQVEAGVRQQADALAQARIALADNKPALHALEQAMAGVASIVTALGEIAMESRVLSLNARIEAARAGPGAGAFAAVASGMSTLATRTKAATDEGGARAAAITQDVGLANRVVGAYELLVGEQDDLLAGSLDNASNQRRTAIELAAITAETAGEIDRAATAIGRVGANAVGVKLLARQLARLGFAASL